MENNTMLLISRSLAFQKMRNSKNLGILAAMALTLWWGAVSAAPLPDPNLVYSGIYADMYLKNLPTDQLEEKVFLDAALASTVTGHVGSQTDLRLVKFSSTTDTLNAANGFANITAQDGYLNNITITAPGYWFADLIFSVNLTPESNSDLSVTAKDKSEGTDTFVNWAAQNGWVNGENRIMVLSTTGNLMQSVTINSQIGFESLGGLDSLKQTEISGLTVVPVPAAAWLFGSGLLSLVGLARRAAT